MIRPRLRACLTPPHYELADAAPEDLLDRLTSVALTAERAGFDALFLMDHFHHSGDPGVDVFTILEGPTTLGALAARTDRIQLGLLTAGNTYRNPAMLAKITTTLDVISRGRALLGIGSGYLEWEHRAYGWDFPSVRERFERLEDALRICRAMFTEDEPEVIGTHHLIDRPHNRPRPIRGDIPILLGGVGERKTLRFVAQYADACNVFGSAGEIRRLLGVLDRHCEEVGRDPGEIERTSLETVVIAPTHDAAQRRAAALRAASKMPEQFDTALVGDRDEVAARVAALRAAGLDGIVAMAPDAYDLEVVELIGRALSDGLG